MIYIGYTLFMFFNLYIRQILSLYIVSSFLGNLVISLPVQAYELYLPLPGKMVALSPAFNPVILKGIKLDPKDPFRFNFYVDSGDDVALRGSHANKQSQQTLKEESTKLIKYFLASLTIPEQDLWVNLSPYEKDRIVPQEFGQTEMGRDLLAQDYLLKQITASLIYPESQFGKEFWKKVYAKAQAKYGTTNIPINTFNKVWIVPEKAVVYENGGTAFVLENHLKVMLEADYLAVAKNQRQPGDMALAVSPSRLPSSQVSNAKASQGNNQTPNAFASQIIREIVIPALTKEVNEGKNFAQLRQVFYSLILATWYKKKIKDSILNKVYSNQNKINGLKPSNVETPFMASKKTSPTRGHDEIVSPSRLPTSQPMQMKAPQVIPSPTLIKSTNNTSKPSKKASTITLKKSPILQQATLFQGNIFRVELQPYKFLVP